MATEPVVQRIPNLPIGPWMMQDGTPTQEYLNFMQTFVSQMQTNFGTEGMVAPSQTTSNITTIQNRTNNNPSGGSAIPNCQNGTQLYNSTTNTIMVSVDNDAGGRIFKEYVLADSYALTAGAITNYMVITINGTQYKLALYALS